MVKHGGKVAQNVQRGKTNLYIVTENKIKARTVLQRNEELVAAGAADQSVDLVRSEWLLSQAELSTLTEPWPHDLVWKSPTTAAKWAELCDHYEDPWRLPATKASLKHSLGRAAATQPPRVSRTARAEFEWEHGLNGQKRFLFRNLVFHFPDDETTDGSGPSLGELQARMWGGEVVTGLGPGVSHVVVGPASPALPRLREERRGMVERGEQLFRLVSPAWLHSSVQAASLLPEQEFAV